MDLNADLGEGFGIWSLGDDEALLDVITSANVACGYHAGDATIMRRVCQAAVARGVRVGAQVGYRDLAGFGRRRIEYAFTELRDEVIYQLGALDAFCRLADTRIQHVKPHGALYHACATDKAQAAAVVAAVNEYDSRLIVLCPPGSVLAQLAVGAGLRVAAEGFADRGYRPDGSLVPRSAPRALLTDPIEVAAQAVRLATKKSVVAIDGLVVPTVVDSICVHGDTPGSVDLARRVRSALTAAGVTLAPLT